MDKKLNNDENRKYYGYGWFIFNVFGKNKKIRTGRHVNNIFLPPIIKPPINQKETNE
jgi:hypothetical protein